MAKPGPEPQNVSVPNCLHPLQTQQCHQAPQQLAQQVVHSNWSHFKPEFSGKPDEDAEAHLLCTNNWMYAHHFVEGVKVQN